MRLFSALLASAAAALAVSAVPNYEISKTSLSIDKHREALDNGDIIIRVQRTDDLFSDATPFQDARLLLEKNTHIALRVQLDPVAGTVNVNDQPIDITSSNHPRVTAIRAEALRLPADHDAPVVDAKAMKSLLDQMSPGIVSVQVKVESENIGPSVPISSEDATSDTQAITIRKVGLWIRVVEVEGQALPHATAISAPILQLIVTGKGNRVAKIETLSINGKTPIDGVLSAPGPAMVPFGRLPEIDNEKASKVIPVDTAYRGNFRPRPPYRAPFHPVKEERPGFLSWLANLFGLSAPNPRMPFGFRGGRRGCRGGRLANSTRVGKKVETHRPMLENPFSGMVDEDTSVVEEAPKDKLGRLMKPYYGFGRHYYQSQSQSQEGQHLQHGHHARPCRLRRFFRNFGIGFVYGMALIGTFFMHPYTLMSISSIAASALVFHVVRRIVVKRRGYGKVALAEDADDEEDEPLTEKEKEVLLESVVVVPEDRKSEDLPRYEEKVAH